MLRIFLFFAIIGLVGAGIGYYLWNKPQTNMQTSRAEYTVEATQLYSEFSSDEAAANARYLGKTIAVRGTVQSASKADDGTLKVVLSTGQDFGIVCNLDKFSDHPRTDFPPGLAIVLKGLCSGYNLDVQLDRCIEMQ
mgnify:CR=1 FL=1